eukprot:TRINITY_DN21159_c0_g1_i1.p1 TRINITY_DN21159_c0_g1~~TRINITY_DN21159_c0_g1_i1.p1  ORF type:complete len:882 (-),score=140.24 TRINITY_DN21159_c0_g1_i1:55-2700(-)
MGCPAEDDDPREVRSGRLLSISVERVEVRLFRQTRTSAKMVKSSPAHFEYYVECCWTGDPNPTPVHFGSAKPPPVASVRAPTAPSSQPPRTPAATGASVTSPGRGGPTAGASGRESDDASAGGSLAGAEDDRVYWWDPLPSVYVVRRRWNDFVRFHDLIERELVVDKVTGCRRIKGHMPSLPSAGDLDAFLLAIAATGDACALGRRVIPENDASDRLWDLHGVYVDLRLRPYLRAVGKVLNEVPAEVLHSADFVKKFVTDGVSCKHKPPYSGPSPKFLGPGKPVLMTPEDKSAMTRKLRRSHSASFLPEDWGKVPPPPKGKANSRTATASATSPLGGGNASPSHHSGAVARRVSDLNIAPGSASSPCERGKSPSGSMGKSCSVPSVGLCDENAEEDVRMGRTRRPTSSHYGFFARNVKGSEFGFASSQEFWRNMRVKEGREISRRTLLKAEDGVCPVDAPSGQHIERLPLLPPASKHEFRSSMENWTSSPSSTRRDKRGASLKYLFAKPSQETLARGSRAELICRDLCEGFRVLALGEPPPPSRRAKLVEPPNYPPASEEETLKVYRTYQTLVAMEESGEGADRSSDDEDGHDACCAGACVGASSGPAAGGSVEDTCPQAGLPKNVGGNRLLPVSWPTIFLWAQNKLDFCSNFKTKPVCGALNRALKLWYQTQATSKEIDLGVPLSRLLQWTWPGIGPETIATMMTWIGQWEYNKIRHPTPPAIDKQERRQLESIFAAMDSQDRGYCTAEDICGGKLQDIVTKLKNIVDIDTVKAVIGEAEITPLGFLELMCEDNYRAHEDALTMLLDDGKRLVYDNRPAIGLDGWIYATCDMPSSEEQQRRLIDAIENEVQRWWQIVANTRRASTPPPASESPGATLVVA